MSDASYGSPSRGSISRQAQVGKFLASVPWVKNRPWARKWHALEDDNRSIPAMTEKQSTDQQREAGAGLSGFSFNFGRQPPSTSGSLGMPQLDTNVGAAPYNVANISPVSSLQTSTSANPFDDVNAIQPAPQPAMVASHHQHHASETSIQGQYGTWIYRTMPDGAGSQPGTYNSQQRQANRLSEVSSLSSGFGDGDIIIQQSWPGQGQGTSTAAAVVVPQPPAPVAPPQSVRESVGQSSDAGWSRRDTIYTQTSEDLPPRFRNINSWVDQQKGRIQRAVMRAKDGHTNQHSPDDVVPPVPGIPAGSGPHGLPPEPELSMMMPDGEVPRRVEM